MLPQVIIAVRDILRQGGVDAKAGPFRVPGAIAVPVNEHVMLNAAPGHAGYWVIELWADVGYPGIEIELPEPIPRSDSTDADAIAVFILRSLFAAGRENQVAHPYVKR